MDKILGTFEFKLKFLSTVLEFLQTCCILLSYHRLRTSAKKKKNLQLIDSKYNPLFTHDSVKTQNRQIACLKFKNDVVSKLGVESMPFDSTFSWNDMG